MKSKLTSYEEQKGDALKTLRREGGQRAGQAYKSIGEAKATPYKTGRTAGIIEDLLQNLSSDERKAQKGYESTESDLWGGVIDPLMDVKSTVLGG